MKKKILQPTNLLLCQNDEVLVRGTGDDSGFSMASFEDPKTSIICLSSEHSCQSSGPRSPWPTKLDSNVLTSHQ